MDPDQHTEVIKQNQCTYEILVTVVASECPLTYNLMLITA